MAFQQFTGSQVSCDVDGCPTTLTLAGSDTPLDHGWGKITPWNDPDYDLCPTHHDMVKDVLKGVLG